MTQTLQNAAYSAALYASGTAQPLISSQLGTQANLTPIRSAAATQAALAESVSLNPPLQAENVQVTIANGVATVTIGYDCPMLTPVLGTSRTVHLSRQATMTVVR
jgi:hypothetical protein